jgi:hypothetical protein
MVDVAVPSSDQGSLTLFHAVIGAFVVACSYFVFFALPVLEGQSDVAAFVGDSFRYHRFAESPNIIQETLKAVIAGVYASTGAFGLFGVSAAGWLLHYVFGEHYLFAVFSMNFMLLVLAMRNYAIAFNLVRNAGLGWFLLLLLLNPFLYATVSSLNKEIWGIFFISAYLRYAIKGQYGRFALMAAFALVLRDAYLAAGIAFLLIRLLPFKRYMYVAGVSLVIPIVSQFTNIGSLDLDQKSAAIFGIFTKIEAVPLGYLLTYPAKVVIQLFAAAGPHRYLEISPTDLYGFAVTASSTFALFISTAIVRRYMVGGARAPQVVVDLFLAYTVVFCFVPFSAHRLFTPLVPLLVFWAFSFKPISPEPQSHRAPLR